MIKLVASDIDGTLVPEGTTSINPEFYEIIRKLKEKGILFVGASGRQYSSMRALLDPVFDDIIFISGNGTNIMQKGEKLYSMGMNQADVARLIAYMRTLPDCIFTASTLDGIYYEQHDEDFERLQVEGYHNQIHLVKDVTKEPVEIQKLAIYRRAGIAGVGEAIEERWKDTFRVFQAGECWIDFVDPAADKGNALKELQKILGIKKEETMAFGDNFNDIGMFQQARESYAVANAADGVKKAAKHVAPSYEENGVLGILKKLAEEQK